MHPDEDAEYELVAFSPDTPDMYVLLLKLRLEEGFGKRAFLVIKPVTV